MTEAPQADPYELSRFIDAQADLYDLALAELQRGKKESHWMWFIFPQYRGLGESSMSRWYAIKSLAEAEAYLAHPVLGPRLRECSQAVLAIENRTAHQIFGSPDDMKLRSCATLFDFVSPAGSCFAQLLDKYYSSQRDPATLKPLGQ